MPEEAEKEKKPSKKQKAEDAKRKAALKRAKEAKKLRKQAKKQAKQNRKKREGLWSADPRELLQAGPDFKLSQFKRNATPGWEGDKEQAQALQADRAELLSELQERLYAERKQSLLIVVQGIDTAGKGGIARHVLSAVDPQGVKLKAFKRPTPVELAHHYLWRIKNALPGPGYIGMFDRSHYEDILVPTVNATLTEGELDKRYQEIAEFEANLIENGTQIIKFALMVSYEEQGLRLRERIDRPDKNWKYSPSDLEVRSQWDLYQRAYQQMLSRSSTPQAPWYVIPADRKWYSHLVTTEIITRTLAQMDPNWPAADFDPQAERARLDLTLTPEALVKYQDELAGVLEKVQQEEAQVDQQATEITETEPTTTSLE